MSLYEIIDRERKRAFGFSDDRQCLFTFGDFRRLLIEIEDEAKREELRWAKANGELARILDLGKAQCGNVEAIRDALQKCFDIDGSPVLWELVYRIYTYDPGKGWWCLGFLGDHKTQAEAEKAVTKYLLQPENQSSNIEVYQIREIMTSSVICTNVVWNPDGTIIEKKSETMESEKGEER